MTISTQEICQETWPMILLQHVGVENGHDKVNVQTSAKNEREHLFMKVIHRKKMSSQRTLR